MRSDNPLQLPFYDAQAGARIYITCTMTTSFSRNPHKSPRYDYNNVVFGLDLSTLGLAAAEQPGADAPCAGALSAMCSTDRARGNSPFAHESCGVCAGRNQREGRTPARCCLAGFGCSADLCPLLAGALKLAGCAPSDIAAYCE